MDNRKTIDNSVAGIKKRSLYSSLLWCAIFVFWLFTDIVTITLPTVYKSLRTVFRFGNTVSLAGLYMLKTQYSGEVSFINEFIASNDSLKKEIKKKFSLRNFISVLIIIVAFLFRIIARIKNNIIYGIFGLAILLIAEAVIYVFTKSIISKIESHI